MVKGTASSSFAKSTPLFCGLGLLWVGSIAASPSDSRPSEIPAQGLRFSTVMDGEKTGPNEGLPEAALGNAATEASAGSKSLAAVVNGSCQTGCRPPVLTARSIGEFAAWMGAVLATPVGSPSLALDSLLFHREDTLRWMANNSLPKPWATFLARELSRTHAIIEMRLIDDKGVVRAHLPSTDVPLGVKTHSGFARRLDLQPFEISGTVLRVGLYHLWSRF
jgi:hypothetical protein